MKVQKLVLKTLVMSMAAAMSAPALADNKLPRIDVVGEGQEAVSKQPGSVVVVTKEDIETIQPMSTEDVLRTVPGINIKKEEESAVVANIGMRGLSAADYKTLILEDGVPVAPGLFVGNGRYYNPRIQRMEGIEVLKGAASLRYGPSTIGGVINYKTKQPEDGVTVSGRVGSWGYKEGTIEAGGSAPSGEAFGGILYTKAESDGFMDKGFTMNDLMVKGGMALGNDQWVSAKFTHYDNEANISYRGLFLDAYKAGKTFNPAPDDYYLTERNSFDINHEWNINDSMKLNTLVYWSQMYRDYWRFGVTAGKTTGTGADKQWDYSDSVTGNNRAFERKGIDTRLNIVHNSFGMRNETEIGLRFDNETMNDTKIYGTRDYPRTQTADCSDFTTNGDCTEKNDSASSVALFAQNRFVVNERLAITPGLRIESYTQETDNLRDNSKDGDTSNTEVIPGVGATYQMSPNAQIFGGVYRAFAPAQNSTAIDDGEDLKLEAERSTNIEVGVRGAMDKLSYEVTAFRMDFENQVIPQNSGGFVNANGGKTLHQGIEFGVDYQVTSAINVMANATYVPEAKFLEDRYDSSGNKTADKGNRVTYAPELVTNVGIGYQQSGLKALLSANHVSSQYTDSQNTKEIFEQTGRGFFTGQIDAYTTVDLTADYAVNKQLNVFGAIKNLTDERYIASLRQGIYVGPERSFELGAKYKF